MGGNLVGSGVGLTAAPRTIAPRIDTLSVTAEKAFRAFLAPVACVSRRTRATTIAVLALIAPAPVTAVNDAGQALCTKGPNRTLCAMLRRHTAETAQYAVHHDVRRDIAVTVAAETLRTCSAHLLEAVAVQLTLARCALPVVVLGARVCILATKLHVTLFASAEVAATSQSGFALLASWPRKPGLACARAIAVSALTAPAAHATWRTWSALRAPVSSRAVRQVLRLALGAGVHRCAPWPRQILLDDARVGAHTSRRVGARTICIGSSGRMLAEGMLGSCAALGLGKTLLCAGLHRLRIACRLRR